MAVASTERFTDNDGAVWKFVWVTHLGGLRLFLTDPSGRETELRAASTPLPDIRRPEDSDAPLPMEIS